MSRIASGVTRAIGSSAVKVLIDMNPDIKSNTQYANQVCPGDTRAQARLKSYLSEHGIHYFAVTDVNSSEDLASVINDYAATNLGETDEFVLVWDRVPSDLDSTLGPLASQFAGIFSK